MSGLNKRKGRAWSLELIFEGRKMSNQNSRNLISPRFTNRPNDNIRKLE